MKSVLAIVVVGAAVPSVTALSFPRAVQGNGYLKIPVTEVKPDLRSVTKRDAFEVALKNRDFYYSMDLQIGNPGQTVTVLLDTGSSELWVNPDCSTASSSSEARVCSTSGQYNPRNSRTPPLGPFASRKLNYGDASDPATLTSAEIAYYSDTITFGTSVVLNQTFGVVTQSDGISTGIMGLAPDLRSGFSPGQPYSLILNSLAEQNLINSRVFSLDLRHSGSDTGALIFGGIDTGKYIGRLERVPITPGARGDPRLAVELTSIGMELANADPKTYPLVSADQNVMLDSGTTLARLHASIARPILADLKAVAASSGYWVVDCSLRTPPLTSGAGDSDSYITFGFGKKTIRVPLSDFILDVGPGSGSNQCYVGLVITADQQQVLGDSVLRAGYFVFDWDNKAVHVAQGANCSKEAIVTVGEGNDAVPATAVGLCDGVSGDSSDNGGSDDDNNSNDDDGGDSATVSPAPEPSAQTPAAAAAAATAGSPETTLNLAEPEPATSDVVATASAAAAAAVTTSPAVAAAAAATTRTKTLTTSSSQTTTTTTTVSPESQDPSLPTATSGSSSSSSTAFSASYMRPLLGSLMTLAALVWNA